MLITTCYTENMLNVNITRTNDINIALYLSNSKYNSTPIYGSYYEDGVYVTLYITSSLQLFLPL